MKIRNIEVLGVLLVLINAAPANAELISRLGGLAVYDTDQNITWLADANLAATNTFGLDRSATLSGGGEAFFGIVGPNGEMDQYTASNTWVNAMNADGGTGYLGVNTWRLPGTTFPDPGCSIDGSGSEWNAGYGCYASELGHLFYNELGGVTGSSILSSSDPDLALFSNIQPDWYWTSSLWEDGFGGYGYWEFDFSDGRQAAETNDLQGQYAWAVADGDVFVTPLPAAIWLFGSGLLALVGVTRRIDQRCKTRLIG